MTNLDGILKSRDITLPTKVRLVKAMVLPVVMYGCETWTIKKAECQRIDAFELRCWRRLLRIPWTARRSKQSILKEISPGCSLEGLMLKLKLQNTLATWCEELTHWKRPWCWERLRAGGEGDNRGWVGWMASLTQWTKVWVDSGSWWWTGRPGGSWGHKESDMTEPLNWTELSSSLVILVSQLEILEQCIRLHLYSKFTWGTSLGLSKSVFEGHSLCFQVQVYHRERTRPHSLVPKGVLNLRLVLCWGFDSAQASCTGSSNIRDPGF